MASGAILAVVGLGGLAALGLVPKEVRRGQLYQANGVALGNDTQTMLLSDKGAYVALAKPFVAGLETLPFCNSGGCTTPWSLDPAGSYVGTSMGDLTTVVAPAYCGAGSANPYSCREVAVINEGAFNPDGTNSIGTLYSVYTRVWRVGEPLNTVQMVRSQFVVEQ